MNKKGVPTRPGKLPFKQNIGMHYNSQIIQPVINSNKSSAEPLHRQVIDNVNGFITLEVSYDNGTTWQFYVSYSFKDHNHNYVYRNNFISETTEKTNIRRILSR